MEILDNTIYVEKGKSTEWKQEELSIESVKQYSWLYLAELEEEISSTMKTLKHFEINLAKSLAKDLTMVRFVLKRRNK